VTVVRLYLTRNVIRAPKPDDQSRSSYAIFQRYCLKHLSLLLFLREQCKPVITFEELLLKKKTSEDYLLSHYRACYTGGKDASCIHFDLGGKESPRAHLNLFNSAASVVAVTVKSET
jgi:hypothetical protein